MGGLDPPIHGKHWAPRIWSWMAGSEAGQ